MTGTIVKGGNLDTKSQTQGAQHRLIGVVVPQAWDPVSWEEDGTTVFSGAFSGSVALPTSEFWSSCLQNNGFLLFLSTQFMTIGCGSPSKRMHHAKEIL